MTTQPLGWPRNAAYDRDQAAEKITTALNEIYPVAMRGVTDEITLRALRATAALQEALRHLERQGAPTRPTEYHSR